MNKMTQDGIDKERIQEVEDFIAGKVAAPPPQKAPPALPTIDPKLNKYVKMLKMHIPKQAVMNKMTQDGIEKSKIQEVEDFIAGKVPPPVASSPPPAVPTID